MHTRHAIRQLDPLIVGKIAAGEVVERPAFAIKELVENSMDAGATAITIEMREGGTTYFRVTDNGCGIAPEDVRMAFARHATSKLRTAEELAAIHTLGFRGEALASIAAVSRAELTTRATGQETGVKAIVSGGVIESIRDAASPEGTSITVRDLFYNVPARQKFLKKPATEAGLVSDLVMRLLLSRPDISFRLMNAERQVYHSPGNGILRDALYSVLGREALGSLVEVKGSAAGCAVHGYVGIGEAARSSRAMQTFILNGRYVRNTFLSQALEEACHERVMTGKHPVCALHLTMPFEAVDVNVHPNKLEVRFQDERALMAGLTGVIRAAFAVEPLQAAPKLPLAETPAELRVVSAIPKINADRPSVRLNDSAIASFAAVNRPSVRPTIAPVQVPATPPVQAEMIVQDKPLSVQTMGIVGVAFREYVFCEQGETLYIIDQHAAHERILYERFRKALDQNVCAQQLLVPQVVQLTHREHAALMASLVDLAAAGFEIEDFGDRSIQVRAVPIVLGIPQLKPFFGELADSITEYKAMPTDEKRRDVLVKLACRKAVKAGDSLSFEAIQGLIDEMLRSDSPPTCPHGRPLVVKIEKIELDKRFRRVQ